MKELGRSLKRLRMKAGLTQRDAASALGYNTPQFVSNNERGISAPLIKTIPKLAKLYNTDARFLFECIRDAKIASMREKLNREFGRHNK